jgi:hypothetical protein
MLHLILRDRTENFRNPPSHLILPGAPVPFQDLFAEVVELVDTKNLGYSTVMCVSGKPL